MVHIYTQWLHKLSAQEWNIGSLDFLHPFSTPGFRAEESERRTISAKSIGMGLVLVLQKIWTQDYFDACQKHKTLGFVFGPNFMIFPKYCITHSPTLGPGMHLPSQFFLWSWMLRVFSRQSIYICREKKLALSMLCCPDSPRKKKLSMKVFNSSFWYSNHHELGGTLPFSHYEVNLGLFSLGFCATQQHQRINHNVLRLLLKNQTCWDVGFY